MPDWGYILIYAVVAAILAGINAELNKGSSGVDYIMIGLWPLFAFSLMVLIALLPVIIPSLGLAYGVMRLTRYLKRKWDERSIRER